MVGLKKDGWLKYDIIIYHFTQNILNFLNSWFCQHKYDDMDHDIDIGEGGGFSLTPIHDL